MKDVYETNVAKAEFREAYNPGNVDRLPNFLSCKLSVALPRQDNGIRNVVSEV